MKFKEQDMRFRVRFREVNVVSDGGYEKGYAAALKDRTDLVATKNGEYFPEGNSSGFNKVTVSAKDSTDPFIEGDSTELHSTAAKVGTERFRDNEVITIVNFPNATSIGSSAFYSANITGANLPSVTSLSTKAFQYCSKMTTFYAPNLKVVGGWSLANCQGLLSLDFPKVTQVGSDGIYFCTKLTSAHCPNLERVDSEGFAACYALEVVDTKATYIGNKGFTSCYSLKAVLLRANSVCQLYDKNAFNYCYHILGTVDSNYNPNGDKDGYFYVPRALVDSYKSATNWSTYASQFRALEDYTVDGTITGALDPNKI